MFSIKESTNESILRDSTSGRLSALCVKESSRGPIAGLIDSASVSFVDDGLSLLISSGFFGNSGIVSAPACDKLSATAFKSSGIIAFSGTVGLSGAVGFSGIVDLSGEVDSSKMVGLSGAVGLSLVDEKSRLTGSFGFSSSSMRLLWPTLRLVGSF